MTDRTILLTITGCSSAGMARIAHRESYPDHLVISMQMNNLTREMIEHISEVTESKVLSKTPSCTYAHYHKAIKPTF